MKVYDSCFSGSLPLSIREMLSHPIVQQTGSADCGLFAIGTAFQAASGLSCGLKQEELRQHLKETLALGF